MAGPGVTITTSVRTGPTNAQLAATATMFVAGVTERGPDGTSHLITSIAEFEDVFGEKVSDGWTYQTVETFFEEGGSRAYVSRIVDDTAVEAILNLVDADTDTCAVLTAAGTGTWANTRLSAEVIQPSGSTFKVKIKLDGATVWTSSTHTDVSEFIDEVNNSSAAALYATAAADESSNIPAVQEDNFTGGTNGGTIGDDDLQDALDTFTNNLGPGAVCAPGFYSSAARTALLAHAQENNRIAVMSFDKDTTVGDAIEEAADFSTEANASYGSFFYPWVKIPNGTSLTQVVPPEGYVCGKRSKVHNLYGSWTPWAGEKTQADFVTGVYSSLSKTDAGNLDDGNVNAIRVINGTVRVYGARSLSSDTANYRFIIAREVLNQITYEAEQALEALLFLPIDGRRSTFARVGATLVGILDRIRIGGGLYEAFDAFGKQIDPGYTVQVNDSNNPLDQLASGKIKAKVGARVSSIGDKIEVEITKSNLTATLV